MQVPISFRDSRSDITGQILVALIAVGVGVAMVVSPTSFVSDPPHVGRGIYNPETAFVLGIATLVMTAYMLRLSYVKAKSRPPVVEARPDGLFVSQDGAPASVIPWQQVTAVEVEWDERVQYLAIRTDSDQVRVPHTRVSAHLERVCRTVNEYRAALLAKAS